MNFSGKRIAYSVGNTSLVKRSTRHTWESSLTNMFLKHCLRACLMNSRPDYLRMKMGTDAPNSGSFSLSIPGFPILIDSLLRTLHLCRFLNRSFNLKNIGTNCLGNSLDSLLLCRKESLSREHLAAHSSEAATTEQTK